MVNHCNIVLIGLRYSSTGEPPTEGGYPTAVVVIVVVASAIIILFGFVLGIILVITRCLKTRIQRGYTGFRAHVCGVYLYMYCVLCLYCEYWIVVICIHVYSKQRHGINVSLMS